MLLALLLVPLACQEPATEPVGPAPTPAELAAFEAAARYSAAKGGLALLVRKGGPVVFERYADGFGADSPHDLLAATKSFWGVACVAAVEDGLLTLDEPLVDTLVEWKDLPAKERMTVRQLLSLTSGLDARSRWVRRPQTKDRNQAALEAGVSDPPGARFFDGPAPFFVFGELLERKLAARGEDPLAYLQRRVLTPVGAKVAYWGRDDAGNLLMPYGAYLTARDWSRFGQLLVDAGRVGEEQLIGAELLAECFRPSEAKAGYGLTFWLFDALSDPRALEEGDGAADEPAASAPQVDAASLEGLPRDVAFASARGTQRLYVIPSLELVVVRLAVPSTPWSDVRFLRLLLGLDEPSPEGQGEDG